MYKLNSYLFKNFKVMLFFSLTFFILIMANYLLNLHILKESINQQQIIIIKSASKRITEWINAKVDSINVVQGFIDNIDHNNNLATIQKILLRSSKIANFTSIYIGYNDNTIISSRNWEKPTNYDTTTRSWYTETIKNNKTTITESYIDIGLNTLVVSICTILKNKKNGVICGILPLENIKNEILNIPVFYEGKTFLIDQNNKILMHSNNKQQSKIFKHQIVSTFSTQSLNPKFKNFIFTYGYISFPKWYIIAQYNKNKVYEKVNSQLLLNLCIYGMSLVVFIFFNLFHNYKQKISDEKLQKIKTLVLGFINHNESGVLIADDKHNIVFYNKQFLTLLKIKEYKSKILPHISQCTLLEQFEPLIKENIFDIITKTKETKKDHNFSFTTEENTKKVYYRISCIPIINNKNNYDGMMLFYKNISEEKEQEIYHKEQNDILFQQSKMADLGTMIGAISHQWRQPLNVLSIIVGNLLQYKKMQQLTDDLFNKNLNRALSNIHYLAETIETFSDFYSSKKQEEIFHIKEAIEKTIFILNPYFKNSGTEIEIYANNTIIEETYNYKNEFQQIIANLILNAKDALDKNDFDNKKISIEIKQTKNCYNIFIKDNGEGIDSNIKPLLFEPFKTTKGSKGTGNGLYLSSLIARKKLQGKLEIISYYKPTTFLLSMPIKNKE